MSLFFSQETARISQFISLDKNESFLMWKGSFFIVTQFIKHSKMNQKQYTMWYNILMAYSLDFRKKVLAHCERTGSITEASHVFQISRNTIYGWLKLKEETGELKHQVKGTKPRKVDRDRLKNYLTDNPDAYLTEIAAEFGCHPTTIHYALKAMEYTRKKRITPTMNKNQKKQLYFLKKLIV